MNEERGGGLEQYCLILYIEKTRRQALQHEASGIEPFDYVGNLLLLIAMTDSCKIRIAHCRQYKVYHQLTSPFPKRSQNTSSIHQD
jgi:hypothetical protein